MTSGTGVRVEAVNGVAGRGSFYIPQLDCLRFCCFLLVYFHHTLHPGLLGRAGSEGRGALAVVQETSGFGLSLFFFLSSYLITSLLMLERERSGTVSLRNFYVRRILRIWPLYFVFLSVVAMVGVWVPALHLGWGRVAAMSLLVGNWYFIVAGMGANVIGPLWSISVEEQFYAIWPGAFRAFSRTGFIWFASFVGAGSLLATALLAASGSSTLSIWLNSLTEAIFFAAGALLALMLPQRVRPSLAQATGLVLGCVMLWVLAEKLGQINEREAVAVPLRIAAGYLMVASGCGLLLLGFRKVPDGLVPGWLVYLGKISYGLYVFHSFAMYLAAEYLSRWVRRVPGSGVVVTFAMTVGMAAVSYRWLEKPFLRLKGRFEVVRTRAA